MQEKFSNNTLAYLSRYDAILQRMIAEMSAAGAAATDSISHSFIIQMIPHHRAAIEMSNNLLRYTTCVPLQRIASGIITEQTQSIAQMEAVLCSCNQVHDSRDALDTYRCCNEQITGIMFNEMRAAVPCNSIDQSFLREMIPHHLGAVRMSGNALRFSLCPELEPILEAIIRSQRRGIRQMQQLLRCC